MSKQAKELRSLAAAQLQTRITDLQRELVKANAQVATGSAPKNPHQIRNAKRTVARILTIRRESELRQALEAVAETEARKKTPAKAGKEAIKG